MSNPNQRAPIAWWGLYYVGAPYGESEEGQLVSRHKSREAAEEARRRAQNNPKYYGSNSVVRIIPK